MKTKEFLKKAIYLFVVLLMCVMTVISGQGNLFAFSAFADTNTIEKEKTNVLDDLKKDNSFSESYYPVILNDYSLQIIQIAESSDNELFVYVYQPSGQEKHLVASSINISTTKHDDINPLNYKLKLLNSDGVFYKYIVLDLTVSTESPRYYCITSICRPFDETIDKDADYGNTVTEVPYVIGRQYSFTSDGISVVDIETITITDKFVGFVRYESGLPVVFEGSCDSHFVAFDTDKPIDKLFEADVYYTSQSYEFTMNGFIKNETYGEKTDKYAYLSYTDEKVEYKSGFIFTTTYQWDRIETVEQFMAENDLTQNVYSGVLFDVNVQNKITEEGIAALEGKKWVLRFAETSYISVVSGSNVVNSSIAYTIVGDVSILRLKFETDGITYNLGVIDNKQTGSNNPINKEEIKIELKNSGKKILSLLILLLLIVILAPFLPFILRAVVWLIALPFKLLGVLFKGIGSLFKKDK